jgi:ferrous iron transport protein B
MKREFGSWKWTFIAIGYQTGIAYVLALIVNQVGSLIFKNTAAMNPVVLDPSIMEEAGEGAVIGGDIVLIVFGVLFAIGLVVALVNAISDAKYRKQADNNQGKKMVA